MHVQIHDRGDSALNMRKNESETQPCLVCGNPIGTRAGSKEAICTNCGYKDPCCE